MRGFVVLRGLIPGLLSLGAWVFGALALADPLGVPKAPPLISNYYLLVEAHSGRVLAAKNEHVQHPPASLAKMLTAYIVSAYIESGRLSMDTLIPISETAWHSEGSRTFLEVGSRVPVRDLMNGLLIQSGNDAAVALSEYLAGSSENFAMQYMNPVAAQMGMTQSYFVNATGLPDPRMYTTAADLAKIAVHTIYDHPSIYPIYRTKTFKYNKIEQSNRNGLLWLDDTVDGIKTGHSEEAGYQLVASAERDGMRLIAIVLGEPSNSARTADAQKLLEFGFRYYRTQRVAQKREVLQVPRVWLGREDSVPVGPLQDVSLTLLKADAHEIKTSITLPYNIEAPIKRGDKLGELTLTQGDQVLGKYPLYALRDVPRGNRLKVLTDRFVRLFR